jgi:hypothetical protein
VTTLLQQTALRMNVPSPLAGEGSPAGQRELGRVRGPSPPSPPAHSRRQPLTRLRFAPPPSPTADDGFAVATRGEGQTAGVAALFELDAVRMNAPSPLAGEGSSAGQRELDWVRGPSPLAHARRQPLTRLRFAKPPSPAADDGFAVATREKGQTALVAP